MTDGTTMVSPALQLVNHGVRLFPLKGKKPVIPGGHNNASKDPAVLAAWRQKHPGSNIGVPTGEINGFFVLDIDGPEGEAFISALEAQHGPLPETVEVKTGKGRHLYYNMPSGVDIRNSVGRIGPKIDIRGNGGYVVVPPSKHPDTGLAYEWTRSILEHAIADAPDWFIRLVAGNPAAESVRAKGSTYPTTDDRSQRYGLAALTNAARQVKEAADGTRNDQLNKAAFAVAQFSEACGIHVALAETILVEAAQGAGLPISEATRTF